MDNKDKKNSGHALPMSHGLIFKDGIKILRIGGFIKKYHPTLKQGTIRYCIKVGKLDYCKIGRERFIVLTEKSLRYQPNLHKNRFDTSTGDYDKSTGDFNPL